MKICDTNKGQGVEQYIKQTIKRAAGKSRKDTVEGRAVKIAAKIIQASGICRYESVAQCRRIFVDERTCDKCIKTWLLAKARKELKKEEAR